MPIAYSKYLSDHQTGQPAGAKDPSADPGLDLFRPAFAALPAEMLPGVRPQVLADELLVVTEEPDQSCIENALKDPYVGLIELGNRPLEVVERIRMMAQLNVIGFSVSSRTASVINLAMPLSQAVSARYAMPPSSRAQMALAIHEASINALAHGNLGLKSAYEETNDDLDTYSRLVRDRASTDEFRNKRIDILAWKTDTSVLIGIRDQGKGYQPMDRRTSTPSHIPDQDRRKLSDRRQSGRGLAIVQQFAQQFWVSAPGSSIVMGFDR
jgi:anti-sigma regulatory factor (Ser/Thr protein kinase)